MESRFIVVGIGGVALDVLLFNVFRLFLNANAVAQPSLLAKLVSSGVGIYYAYHLHLRWTFKEMENKRQTDKLFGKFIVFTSLSLLIPVAFLYISQILIVHPSVASDNFWGNFVGTIAAATFRFATYKKYVFT
jgi:putative flippase GtrA